MKDSGINLDRKTMADANVSALENMLDNGVAAATFMGGLLTEDKTTTLDDPCPRVLVIAPKRQDHRPEDFAKTVCMYVLATDRFCALTVHGYNDDQRALADIPEVRRWFRKFIEHGGLTGTDPTGETLGPLASDLVLAPTAAFISGLLPFDKKSDVQFSFNWKHLGELEALYRPKREVVIGWLRDSQNDR